MLDSNKDNLKLDAMKRIIGVCPYSKRNKKFDFFFFKWVCYIASDQTFKMVAKGRNASDLFPAVVKNVVSKNMEVS